MNKLGVKVRKSPTEPGQPDLYVNQSSFKNPYFQDEDIWWFADAPHLIKLLRNNLLKHGLEVSKRNKMTKADFERLLYEDHGELRSHHKLTQYHLNVKGREKMRVRPAVELFSATTAALWRKVHPNRPKQADFIQLINDWFDLMNSKTVQEVKKGKMPLGQDLLVQIDLLKRTEKAIMELRVGDAKYLYPFQRGFLTSINSIQGLFHDLSGSSLRVSYLLTHRVNQDIAENAFSVIRKFGGTNTNPTAVDAKRRLKLLCLSWGANTFRTSSVEAEDNIPCLSAQMMDSLKTSGTDPNSIPSVFIPQTPIASNSFNKENVGEVLQTMRMELICEQGGKEYLAGYVASKLGQSLPGLKASVEETQLMGDYSWIKSLGKDNLCVPSLLWLNQCEILEQEFRQFHKSGGKYKINESSGVLRGFSEALKLKYPTIPEKALEKYLKARLFIRIKDANKKIVQARKDAAKARSDRWTNYQVRLNTHSPSQEEEEDYEEEGDSENDDDVQEPSNASSFYRRPNSNQTLWNQWLEEEVMEEEMYRN